MNCKLALLLEHHFMKHLPLFHLESGGGSGEVVDDITWSLLILKATQQDNDWYKLNWKYIMEMILMRLGTAEWDKKIQINTCLKGKRSEVQILSLRFFV